MTISGTASAPAYPPLPSDPPSGLLPAAGNTTQNALDVTAAASSFAAFHPYRPTPDETGIETEAMPIDFRARHPIRHYQGDTDTGTLQGPQYAAEEQALADLRIGQGKYARLPVIRDILLRWQTAGPSPRVHVAYGNWVDSGSLELLLDALVAQMRHDGSWYRLARTEIAVDGFHERLSDALTGVPYRRTQQADRQACEALSDWDALSVADDRALEKKLRFIKVMEAAFLQPDTAQAGRA